MILENLNMPMCVKKKKLHPIKPSKILTQNEL